MQAFDINAACSGYLYALQASHDFLKAAATGWGSRGGDAGRALVVTTEHLSPLLRKDDFDTAIIFGDAASATLLGSATFDGAGARLRRPVVSALGDGAPAIRVPAGAREGFIEMRGKTVFANAVRLMEEALTEACARENLQLRDLDLIVPHQANQRILDAIGKRLHLPGRRLFSNIRLNGNTSSSSIPLCLAEILGDDRRGEAGKIGLCAFGGGFTYGAAILDLPPPR